MLYVLLSKPLSEIGVIGLFTTNRYICSWRTHSNKKTIFAALFILIRNWKNQQLLVRARMLIVQ